jgi:hypothetical protein
MCQSPHISSGTTTTVRSGVRTVSRARLSSASIVDSRVAIDPLEVTLREHLRRHSSWCHSADIRCGYRHSSCDSLADARSRPPSYLTSSRLCGNDLPSSVDGPLRLLVYQAVGCTSDTDCASARDCFATITACPFAPSAMSEFGCYTPAGTSLRLHHNPIYSQGTSSPQQGAL